MNPLQSLSKSYDGTASQCSKEEPQQQSRAAGTLAMLRGSLNAQARLLGRLQDRLTAALRPAQPQPTANCDPCVSPALAAPIVDEIRQQDATVCVHNEMLDDLLARLEV